MKIETNKLYDYIKKASLNGRINTMNINFTDVGLVSNIRCPSNVNLTLTALSKDAFAEYSAIGQYFIKNTSDIMKYLETFVGEISIEITDQILKISNANRKGFVILGSELVCDNVYEDQKPSLNLPIKESIKKSDLTNVFKDINALKVGQIDIIKEDNDLKFKVGIEGQSDYFITKIVTDVSGNDSSRIGESFKSVIDSIDDDFTLEFGTDMPIKITEKTEHISFEAFIAPMKK